MTTTATRTRRQKPAPGAPAPAEPAGLAKTLRIDPEFASLIPALAADELARLEASILAEGCRDPLVVWEGENILLDGHNRHAICTKHQLPYPTVARAFPSRAAARDFILHTQLGRRNLSAEAVSYLRGKRYLETKRQGERTDLTPGQKVQKWASEQLGAEYKVNEKTIRRDGTFARAVDQIAEHCGDAARRWILSRALALARSGVLRLSKLSPEEQREYIEEALRGQSRPRFPSAKVTITLPLKPADFVAQLVRRRGPAEAETLARLLLAALGADGEAEDKAGGQKARRRK